MTAAEHYRRIRAERPTTPARWALQWARHAAKVDDLSARIEWEPGRDYPLVGTGTVDGIEVRVYDDAEPYEWGDIEPSEQERAELLVIVVGVGLPGEPDLDTIGGVGYFGGDYETEGLSAALEYGFIETARKEIRERAEMAARDIVTLV